jgi:hypothetical protein
VHFVLVTEPEIPLGDGDADAMFSCQVFQHFSRFDGVARYLRLAFAKLRPLIHDTISDTRRTSTSFGMRRTLIGILPTQ